MVACVGGQVGVVGHIDIYNGVQVNAGANILKSIKHPGIYAGSPNVMSAIKWNRIAVYFQRLEKLFTREEKK